MEERVQVLVLRGICNSMVEISLDDSRYFANYGRIAYKDLKRQPDLEKEVCRKSNLIREPLIALININGQWKIVYKEFKLLGADGEYHSMNLPIIFNANLCSKKEVADLCLVSTRHNAWIGIKKSLRKLDWDLCKKKK